MRVDCRNLQELQEHVADLSHGDRLVLLTDKGALRFRINNNGIDFHESDEKGNLLMGELIYCPECGHPKWDKDHFNCTYESLVGEKGRMNREASAYAQYVGLDAKPTKDEQAREKDRMPKSTQDIVKAESLCPVCIQDKIFMQHDLDYTKKTDMGEHVGHCPCTTALSVEQLKNGMEHHPKCTHNITLQLLVIDLNDSCVVKVEKGEFKWTVAHTFNVDKSVMLSGHTFAELREELDGEKPVPRIELSEYGNYNIWSQNDRDGISPATYDALSELAGKPLPIWEGGTWEELIGLQKEGDVGWIDARILTIWRYKR